jgi:hypothetical protein
MATKTITPNGVSTVDQIFALVEDRYAPQRFEIPDYPGSVVEVQMLSSGEEEHANMYARMADGSRNSDAFIRIFVAYALASPKLAEDKDKRVQAEKIAALLERFPTDWMTPIFRKAYDMTTEYQQKRQEREREGDKVVPFFPRVSSGRLSLQTVSDDSDTRS